MDLGPNLDHFHKIGKFHDSREVVGILHWDLDLTSLDVAMSFNNEY